jgi:hypothetical protein
VTRVVTGRDLRPIRLSRRILASRGTALARPMQRAFSVGGTYQHEPTVNVRAQVEGAMTGMAMPVMEQDVTRTVLSPVAGMETAAMPWPASEAEAIEVEAANSNARTASAMEGDQ